MDRPTATGSPMKIYFREQNLPPSALRLFPSSENRSFFAAGQSSVPHRQAMQGVDGERPDRDAVVAISVS